MNTTLLNWRRLAAVVVFAGLLGLTDLATAQPGRFGGRDRERGSGDERGRERGSGDERSSGGERGPGGERRFGGSGDRGPGERGGGPGGYSRGGDERRGPTPSSGSPGSGSANPSSSRPRSGESTSVQGFGSTGKSPQTPGFNVPLEAPGGNLQDRYDKRVIDKADKEVMPRFDRDKDGFLSTEESKESDWDPPFADSDLDKDGRLSRFELYERYAKKMSLPPKTAVVYNAATGGAKPAESASGGPDMSKVTEYAKGLLNRYDDNKSGVLEKDEWKEMKADYHAADVNKDNVITLEELTAKLAAFATAAPTSSPPSGSAPPSSGDRGRGRGGYVGGRGGEKGDKSTTDTRKSYRIPTATERLPKGLPDWFARNDTDADGQVMMAEYMTDLSETKATEFAKFDLNGDGIITPDECLEADGKTKKK